MARRKLSPWGFIGMGAMACLLFLDLGTAGRLAWWVTTSLVVVWLVAMLPATRWFEPKPGRVPWVAVTMLALWLLAVFVAPRA